MDPSSGMTEMSETKTSVDRPSSAQVLVCDFGNIPFDEKETISFPEGLYGFEGYSRYILWKNESTLPFRWLICVENPRLMFPVVDPKMVNPEYSPRIGSEDPAGDLFAIVTIGDSVESVTVNLQAPVVIDGQARLGKQVILTDANYPIRYRVIH
jgi:flagellar assembly factor FliW